MNSKLRSRAKMGSFLRRSSVPIMFIVICAFCIPLSGLSPSYLINEIVTRMGRNAFLILSLLIPIMAGMGLNFGMTLGAMAGQIGLIFACDWQIIGIPGMVLAAEALLSKNPDPTEDDIREGLSGNLCRCTGYNAIVDAVYDAAKEGKGLW